jgi:hypothetical protein
MHKRAIALSGVLMIGFSAAQAAEPTAASAEQFLRGLYEKYAPNGNPTPFVYPDAKTIADPDMLALLKRDRDKCKGEICAMDSDPVCDCQGWDGLKVVSLRVAANGGNAASADVVFTNTGFKHNAHFSLVWTKDGWRIHDIGTKDQPSLNTYLKTYKY